MELSLRYLWAGLLFFLAFLNLSARLASQAAEMSAIPEGLDFTLYYNNSKVGTDCRGLWSCSLSLCEIAKDGNFDYLTLAIQGKNQCGIRGISWINKFPQGQAAIAFIVLACVTEIIVLLLPRQPRIYLYVAIGSSYLFLTLAYVCELSLTHRYIVTTSDRQPSMIAGWNITESIFLLIAVAIANLAIVPETKYDPIN